MTTVSDSRSLDLDQIQGNILAPFRCDHQAYVVVSFRNRRAGAKQWLGALADSITSAADVPVGTPAVGLFWVGNLINGAVVTRARYRAIPSWTINCPECGADCTRDLYPARTGGTACRHSPSFVADISVEEVIAETLELLRPQAAVPAE